MVGEPFAVQHDTGGVLAAELSAAGFEGAKEIGRGGFGVVFRCSQAALERVVAVKVLTADLEEHRPRFVREQKAMCRLTGHPNIVAVLQVGETPSGQPFLVMPYLQRGCLHERIRRLGPLPEDEALTVGVKMAGALESAHRLSVVHRDVKPANIMLTDYGQPALTDFGIAHVSGGFQTAAGIFTGTPAFTAPEVLAGEPPSPASDVYGLGATLFCVLTGHAAYERRSGEEVIAQFVRIAADPLPDLRDRGIPADLTEIVEKAMVRQPRDRPSALALGEALQDLQAGRGLAVDDIALQGADLSDQRSERPVAHASTRPRGRLPAPLAKMVGRRGEVAELRSLLLASRLVPVTGVGGVGKTTLANHAAREQQHDFADGAWLVELAELRDDALITEVVAATLGVRNQPARPLLDVLTDFLRPREALLVLDNCEHLIDAVADFTQTLLRGCPLVHILATSREAVYVEGESVLVLSPLPYPAPDTDPTPNGLADYDAVALFVERARAAVAGFALTERNCAAVSRICSQLDGLPLALELAAARLRAMSLQQVGDGLADRYTLLRHGRRSAPARQQTLTWCVNWSYDLCTPAEQQLWARLSVFAGSFDLPAAQHVCGHDLSADDLLDALSALVDKSILIREEHDDKLRFRLLETLRDYGKARLAERADHPQLLARRHTHWYQLLLDEADTKWFTKHQVDWIQRLTTEMPNIREALQFTLFDSPTAALQMASALRPMWIFSGMLGEGHRWLDLALAAIPPEPTPQRLHALYHTVVIAEMQGDLPAAQLRIAEARRLLEIVGDSTARAEIDCVDGFMALVTGELDRARDCLQQAHRDAGGIEVQAAATLSTGWLHEIEGDLDMALTWFEKALVLTDAHGDWSHQTLALASMGAGCWVKGDLQRAQQFLRRGLILTKLLNDPWTAAQLLEMLAWISSSEQNPRRVAVLMAAACALGGNSGAAAIPFAQVGDFHEECERRTREEIGPLAFDAAWRHGSSLTFTQAVDFALDQTTGKHHTLIEQDPTARNRRQNG